MLQIIAGNFMFWGLVSGLGLCVIAYGEYKEKKRG